MNKYTRFDRKAPSTRLIVKFVMIFANRKRATNRSTLGRTPTMTTYMQDPAVKNEATHTSLEHMLIQAWLTGYGFANEKDSECSDSWCCSTRDESLLGLQHSAWWRHVIYQFSGVLQLFSLFYRSRIMFSHGVPSQAHEILPRLVTRTAAA